jgi:hypothetical protein
LKTYIPVRNDKIIEKIYDKTDRNCGVNNIVEYIKRKNNDEVSYKRDRPFTNTEVIYRRERSDDEKRKFNKERDNYREDIAEKDNDDNLNNTYHVINKKYLNPSPSKSTNSKSNYSNQILIQTDTIPKKNFPQLALTPTTTLPNNKTKNMTAMVSSKKLGNSLFYNNKNSLPTKFKEEIQLIDKLKALIQGCVVYKRNFCNINLVRYRKQYYADALQYNPIVNNSIVPPEEYGFKKFFLQTDKSLSKLLFNKIKDSDKFFEMYISSISKVAVPTITKNIIFVNQIFKKLKQKGINDISKYLEINVDKLIKLYYKSFKNETIQIDENLLNEEYRQLLLNCNKFIMYIYLKPDDETRIEIICENYEDFKHWRNGIEELLNNKQVKDVIKRKDI